MQYFGIQFFNQFKCAQGDCPQTCCKGWQILIDANTMEQIEKEPENKRRELRRHIAGMRKGQPQIRKNFGRCPYHTKEQLCGLQLRKRTDLMPRVCREYPRRTVSFGSFAEITMELACPVVAQLFLEEKKMLSMQPLGEQEHEVLWKIGNEDPAFLEWLQQLREVLVKEAQQVMSFDAAFLQHQYVCVDALHEMLMRNKLKDAKQILEKYQQDVWEEHRPEDTKRIFFSMELVDKVIAHLLDTPNLAIAPCEVNHWQIENTQKKPSNATIMKLALDDFRLFLRLFLSPVSSSASTSLLNQRQLTQFSAVSDARPQSKVEVYSESVSLQHQNSPC